ncbi:MAG: tripartite tricarboxylate transporter TctB family protein [Alphaproteobacteria bacterium]|nr:tripartite tricarboxylate transporter TctB family protein [Alphaproteobacteria bacterium]
MSGTMSRISMISGLGFVAALAAFYIMLNTGFSLTVLMIPVFCAWGAALIGLKPMVDEEHYSALYFAFGIMALMIFLLHETYEIKGTGRTFPLIIGYSGLVLSVFDIASITDTRIGHFVTRFFGAALEPDQIKQRPVRRELLIFAVMGLGVFGIWLFGFLIASPIFVFLWMWIGGGKTVKLSFYVGFATLAFIYGLFEAILKYELFPGVVTVWVIELIQG